MFLKASIVAVTFCEALEPLEVTLDPNGFQTKGDANVKDYMNSIEDSTVGTGSLPRHSEALLALVIPKLVKARVKYFADGTVISKNPANFVIHEVNSWNEPELSQGGFPLKKNLYGDVQYEIMVRGDFEKEKVKILEQMLPPWPEVGEKVSTKPIKIMSDCFSSRELLKAVCDGSDVHAQQFKIVGAEGKTREWIYHSAQICVYHGPYEVRLRDSSAVVKPPVVPRPVLPPGYTRTSYTKDSDDEIVSNAT